MTNDMINMINIHYTHLSDRILSDLKSLIFEPLDYFHEVKPVLGGLFIFQI